MEHHKFSARSIARMADIDPRLMVVAEGALKISPIDFGIPEFGGLRTAEDQQALHLQGKSKCDGVVKKSYHQTGRALDVYAYVDGKASWDKEHLAVIAAAMLQTAAKLGIELEWGGLWTSFYDGPHFQLPDSAS